MIAAYPFEWIDSLLFQTLNSKKTNIGNLSENDLTLIEENLSKESQKIQIQLKYQIFILKKNKQIKLLVCKYHSSLVYLLDNAIEYQKNTVFQTGILYNVLETIISTLDDLLAFVENNYSDYLSLDQRVPISYVRVFRKETLLRLQDLKEKKVVNERNSQITDIVFAALSDSGLNEPECIITYRKILYHKALLKQLEAITDIQEQTGLFSGIDELLIEMNFNNHHYISYLIDQIQEFIASQESLIDKLSALLHYYKELSQLPSNKKMSFDPERQNIKDALENWIIQEIVYLEKKLELALKTNSGDLKPLHNRGLNDKMECDLSADQIALILRATDEARVVKARSMNYFFKMIVPHLSTPFKKELSYHSVRSKSYAPEDRDKEKAIQTLERLIKKIKSY